MGDDLSMTEAEEKVWRDAKNAEMRAKRKRNRKTTSALPLPSAPALAPIGWGEGWDFGPLPLPPGGPPLCPSVALNFLRNLQQPQQQYPLFQALPPPQLFPAPPPPQLSINSQVRVPHQTLQPLCDLPVSTTTDDDAFAAPSGTSSDGHSEGEDLETVLPALLPSVIDDLSSPELAPCAPVVHPPDEMVERNDSLGLLAQAASGADHAGSLLTPSLVGAGSAARVDSIVDQQTKEKLHKDSYVLFKLSHLLFHFLWIIVEWAEGGKGPMLYVQGDLKRVHLRNRYFDNMNSLLKTPSGIKQLTSEDRTHLDDYNSQMAALHRHFGKDKTEKHIQRLADAVSAKIGCTNANEPRSISLLTAPNGQALHLDDIYYNLAVILFLNNNVSTTLVDCPDDVMPFCWEHAPVKTFNVEQYTAMVFRGHFPHAAPVVPANWQTRWVVYLGYFTSDIDKVEETLHFEPNVRGLTTGNWKMGKPSCCHSVWDWAPKPFDPGSAMLKALKEASKSLSVVKEMALEQAKEDATREAKKAAQTDKNMLSQDLPLMGERRSARIARTENDDQDLPAPPGVTDSDRLEEKASLLKFEQEALAAAKQNICGSVHIPTPLGKSVSGPAKAWFAFRDVFDPLKLVLQRKNVRESSLADIFTMWAATKMFKSFRQEDSSSYVITLESVSLMKFLTYDHDYAQDASDGWHVDREHVAQPPASGDAPDNVGMVLFNVSGASSTVQFRRSPLSNIHEIVVKSGHCYVVRGPWFRAAHRFKAAGPRIVARLGFSWTGKQGTVGRRS